MTRDTHDSPYSDEPNRTGHAPRSGHKGKRGRARKRPHSAAAHASGKTSPSHTHHASPATRRKGHAAPKATAHKPHAAKKTGRKRSRRGRGKGTYRQPDELTSHPTTRNAYVGTREWLLAQHGPVCAYCGTRHAASTMTLDHVAPRRGQTAYDRRDNLVLACQNCNKKKRDLAPLAFLLGAKSRAINLVRYGSHLSAGLLDLARSLIPAGYRPPPPEEDSPYRD